jgi:hypothetical protein
MLLKVARHRNQPSILGEQVMKVQGVFLSSRELGDKDAVD